MITTISGKGPVLGCIIVSEIADMSRFDSPFKLVAYAGLDASVFSLLVAFIKRLGGVDIKPNKEKMLAEIDKYLSLSKYEVYKG